MPQRLSSDGVVEVEYHFLWLNQVQQDESSHLNHHLADWGRISCLSGWSDFRCSARRNSSDLIRIWKIQVQVHCFWGIGHSLAWLLWFELMDGTNCCTFKKPLAKSAIRTLWSSGLKQDVKSLTGRVQMDCLCRFYVRCIALSSLENVSYKLRSCFFIACEWWAAGFLNLGCSYWVSLQVLKTNDS